MRLQKLSDYIEIKHGFAFSGDHITDQDNNIVLVTPGNFRIGGGFQEEKCKFFNGDLPDDYILNAGDYIVTMTDLSKDVDTLGFSAKVPSTPYRTYLHNQRIGKLYFVGEDCDKDYIYYLMQTHHYQRTIANSSTGATVHHTSPSKIYEYRYKVPPIHVQRRISGILAAYDDLIENNRRQIKLLEEAAQRLYKEWFVDLRFPGWETTPIVDGLPEGWTKTVMSKVCKTIGGGTPSTKVDAYYLNGTIMWVTPTDITKNNSIILLDTEKKITEAGLKNSSAKIVPPYTILMTSRASVGFFGICDQPVCTNQGFISCIPFEKSTRMYLLYNLMSRIDEIRSKAGGSTYLEINKGVFRNMKIVLPERMLLSRYLKVAFSYILQMKALSQSIRSLQNTRDALLPKLMNGELEALNALPTTKTDF